MALVFVPACGAGEEPPPPAPGTPVRVVFKHQRMLGGAPELDRILDDFRAAHPGIEVASEVLPSEQDIAHQFYATNLEAGARDFDVLERAAREVLAAEKDPRLKGFVFPGRQSEGLVCFALEVVRAAGGDVFDGGRLALERPETVGALRFLRGLIASGVAPAFTTS